MPTYPRIPSLDPDGLVPPDDQPTYLELPGEDVASPVNLCGEIVDRHVAEGRGDRPAITFADDGTVLTFRDLQARTQAVAGALVALGVEVGDRVGVRYPNRPDGIVAMLAAWRAGAAVVPVPPQARAAELPGYVADARARVLVADDSPDTVEQVGRAGDALGVEAVVVGPSGEGTPFLSLDQLVADAAPLVDPVPVPADMPSIFWHTGGTTGQPKCCYHTARQYLLAGRAAGRVFELDPDHDVHLAFPGPIGHAAGMIGRTNVSLLNGVGYVEVSAMGDPRALLKAMSDHRVTWMMAVATTWAHLLKVYREAPDDYDLSALQKPYGPMMSVVAEEVTEGWAALGHPVQNLMGSTQFATWFMVPPPSSKSAAGCVGVPSPGYEAKIVDAEAPGVQELPRGEIGLLAVRGPSGLTYWNRPEMQARDVREGWTVMDDLAKMDEEGAVWYLGRSDFMISTSGFKVAPVEVEEAAGRHPAVAEVSVVGSPDPDRGEVVTAFLVLRDGVVPGEALAREVQDHVKQEISPYKYPRRIVFVPALPRDLVGKVQVRDLRSRAAELAFPPGQRSVETSW